MKSPARWHARLPLLCSSIALVLAPGTIGPPPVAAQSMISLTAVAGDDARDLAPDKAPKTVKSFDLEAIDKSVDPCTDFYHYACGNWIKQNPLPSDQVRWNRSFSMLNERNFYLLWKQLDLASKSPKSALEKQYGDFYGACMDTASIEKRGIAPLTGSFSKIDGLTDQTRLAMLAGDLQGDGEWMALFDLYVGQDFKDSTKNIAQLQQDGLSLPDRDYYISDEKHFQTIREQYLAHVTKMFTLAGDAPGKAANEAADVMRIETALAKGSMSRTDQRQPENIYHIMTVADLQKLAPDFDWPAFFKAVHIGSFETLNVANPDYFKTLAGLIQSEPANAWRSYFRWHVIHDAAPDLPTAFFAENFAFFGKILNGQEEPTPRWKRCTYATDGALGEAVGQDWVKQNFPPQAKDSMDKLVAALDKALSEDIQTLPWMSDATRKAAQEKLALFRNKIGYPEKWRDYAKLTVKRDDPIGNGYRSTLLEQNHNYEKLGKPVDEKEWGMTPPTVDAYYNGSMNDINFPAGILQPPFFDFKIDPGVNFGGIGAVIGHEMTHGFDDEGSKFDGHGNMREWQTEADRKAFTERTGCVADEYSGFASSPAHDGMAAQNLNGKLTLGENTADNGGLRIAYIALLNTLADEKKNIGDKIDNYTEAQRFFLNFGQVWCQNATDETLRQLALTDPHSPGQWRVNGTVQNFEEFGKAFGCKKGQPMYPVHSCRVW